MFYCLRKDGECSLISVNLGKEKILCNVFYTPIGLVVLKEKKVCICTKKGKLLEFNLNKIKKELDTNLINVSCFHYREEKILFGAKKKLELWNWNKCLWKAIPLKSNYLGISKTFIVKSCFLQSSNQLLCITSEGFLKFYNIYKDAKPFFKIKISDKSLQKLVPTEEETSVYITGSRKIYKIGLGKQKKIYKVLKSSIGTIKDLIIFDGLVIEVGSDRYLRVHDPSKICTVKYEIFLREKLTSMLVKKDNDKIKLTK